MDRRAVFVAVIYLLHNMVLKATSSDLNSDREALLAFSDAVPHSRNLNWKNSPSSVCSWVGVTCRADQSRVIALRLPAVGLVGRIPENTIGQLDALQFLSIRSNLLAGDFPSDLLSIPSLQLLNLQYNNFSGNLPLTSFPSSLTIIDLSFNSFTGGIPPAILNLTQLRFLNLQNNSLSGPIPEPNLPKLRSFNVSNNNLTGPIPASLQGFTAGAFLGNSLLCGPPLAPCSGGLSPSPSPFPQTPPQQPPSTPNTSNKKISTGVTIAIGAGILTFLLISALFVLVCLVRKRGKKEDSDVAAESKGAKSSSGGRSEKPIEQYGSGAQEAERNKLVFFDGCSYNFDLEDLLRASAEVLGKGSYGTAYKAVLEDGTIVVVKRLKEVVVGKKDFEQQMGIIGKVGQHPNISPLRAYYYSKDEKLMVFDYLPTGSLSSALHGNRGGGGGGRTPLKWENRVKIALDVARGLEHIHSEGGSKFCHGNIKSSNILLTQGMDDALVSDFGLAQLMNSPALPRNMVGYRAPELIETGKFSQKSDVYSFGVVLLELLTAKNALHSPGTDEKILDLPKWVQSVVREEWTAEVFDSELMSFSHVEEHMVLMLQIAMACVVRSPDQRPKMKEIVSMIVELRHSNSETRPPSEDRSNKDSIATTPQEET